ncbi:MAG TPA: 3'(2'),5'-bisphosphate nucleotidase CysQ [Pyrinomonadaceae bacterium]|nr:3'(2'),5'-bisphosphate nucleotidase CysQ [Pyrinomonadaceae bacterium]
MLEKELETAVVLARRAGAVILDFYAAGVETEQKIFADNFSEPVTIADRTASAIIVEGLIKAFPGDGILSEEEADDDERLSKKRVWVIDPIDGTYGFIEKTGDFAVQIGLAENGEVVLGVVFMPTEDYLYFAVKGAGAFLVKNNGEPQQLKVSDKIDFSEMNLAVSRNHRSPKMSRVVEKFGLKSETRRGSVGLKVGLIVRKTCDLYVHLSPRTKHWDTCAPEIILREAGGEMTDLFGARIVYNTPDVNNHNGILATNGAAHAAAVAEMKPLLTEFGRVKIKARK